MKLLLLTGFALFLFCFPVSLSWADMIYVSLHKTAGQGTSDDAIARLAAEILKNDKAFNEGKMTKEQAMTAATSEATGIETLRSDLAPAPLLKNEQGFYFQGTIIDYMPGLRTGDGTVPENYDRFLFRAFGSGGQNPSANPALISVSQIKTIYHDYDNERDFVWRFSNRHELLNAEFGSDQHRQSIYALFDPDNDLGLSQGGQQAFGTDLKEGVIPRFILEAVPTLPEIFRTLRWVILAPDSLGFSAVHISQRGPFGAREALPLNSHPLIVSMARARKYEVVDDSMYEKSRNGLAILCTMILANPDLVAKRSRSATQRAHEIGLGCYETIALMLRKEYEVTYDRDRMGVLPVTAWELRRVILETMNSEALFRRDLTAFGSNLDYLGDLKTIAMGERAEDADTETQQLADAQIRKLISPIASDSTRDRKFYERSRRAFRERLEGIPATVYYGTASDQARSEKRWLLGLYCETGWGHHEDSIKLVDYAIDRAMEILEKEWRGEPAGDNSRKNLNLLIKRLVLVTQHIRTDDPEEVQLYAHLQVEFDKLRRRLSDGDDQDRPIKRFLALYDNGLKSKNTCH